MRYPVLSLSLSLIIWVLIIIFTSFFLNSKSQSLPPSVDIEVNLITKDDVKISKSNYPNKAPKTLEQQVTEDNNSNQSRTISYRPLPQIPDELRQEAYKSYAIARFYISPDGLATVELIQPCSNPKLNYLLLKSLRKWRFTDSDKPSVQDIRVEFKVE